ncbi:hypothetical protein EVAR_69771_1 [Eumeta japonica]|uniref:Uncharacterized protein n=1 Tax=Eumeta variegata TaxID=151549 RepID=A0A4C1SKX0_EUMVA|nr:hypothetical protein EVAR_69771_1 [Eumeta japonica]
MGRPIRNCPGVKRDKSVNSDETRNNGHEQIFVLRSEKLSSVGVVKVNWGHSHISFLRSEGPFHHKKENRAVWWPTCLELLAFQKLSKAPSLAVCLLVFSVLPSPDIFLRGRRRESNTPPPSAHKLRPLAPPLSISTFFSPLEVLFLYSRGRHCTGDTSGVKLLCSLMSAEQTAALRFLYDLAYTPINMSQCPFELRETCKHLLGPEYAMEVIATRMALSPAEPAPVRRRRPRTAAYDLCA